MQMHFRCCCPFLIGVFLLAMVQGCSQSTDNQPKKEEPSPAALSQKAALSPTDQQPQAEEKVEVTAVKFNEIEGTIKKLKGKVVVIDFWADS